LEYAKAILNSRSKLKDLGKAQWLLGREVMRNQDLGTIMLHQAAKIKEALKEFRMEGSHPCIWKSSLCWERGGATSIGLGWF